MMILLIRHADAVEKGKLPDDARWLTARGRQEARRAGERLLAAGFVPDVIVASPLVRAVQTAELVAAGLGFDGEIESLLELAPAGSPRTAALELEALGEVVAAVGHEPSISALAAVIVGGSPVPFRKAQVLVIQDGKVVTSMSPDA